jgi:hypothetical protein
MEAEAEVGREPTSIDGGGTSTMRHRGRQSDDYRQTKGPNTPTLMQLDSWQRNQLCARAETKQRQNRDKTETKQRQNRDKTEESTVCESRQNRDKTDDRDKTETKQRQNRDKTETKKRQNRDKTDESTVCESRDKTETKQRNQLCASREKKEERPENYFLGHQLCRAFPSIDSIGEVIRERSSGVVSKV